jgi:hypothetical protein
MQSIWALAIWCGEYSHNGFTKYQNCSWEEPQTLTQKGFQLFNCGGDRNRTGVQTYSSKVFYMLISLLSR